MARPKKQNVSYFPHNCKPSKTLEILENKYKNDGYAFFYKLFEVLGDEPGHYYDCRQIIDFEYLAGKMGFSSGKLREMLDNLCDWGKIDTELWNQGVIWYQGYVETLEDAYKERTTTLPTKNECIDKLGLIKSPTTENHSLTVVNEGFQEEKERKQGLNEVFHPIKPQIKENKRKLKENKQKKTNDYNIEDVHLPEEDQLREYETLMDDKTKEESSSLVFIKKSFLKNNLEELQEDSGLEGLFQANKPLLAVAATLYTATQKNIGDARKYKRRVEKALTGNIEPAWDLLEVMDDVNAYADKRLETILGFYGKTAAAKKEQREKELIEERYAAAFNAFQNLNASDKKEVNDLAFEIARRKFPGINITTSGKFYKDVVVKVMSENGYLQGK